MLEQISQAAAAHQFEILAYCFMADHLHLLVEARSSDSDLISFANLVKQRLAPTGFSSTYFATICVDSSFRTMCSK